MNALTLNKAIELYEILGAHIPDVDNNADIDAMEFIGRIMNSVNSSGNHAAYTLSIELMSDKTLKDLQEMNSQERLELFVDGLVQNKIYSLALFCRNIGFDHANC
jgi:hypothetical protein